MEKGACVLACVRIPRSRGMRLYWVGEWKTADFDVNNPPFSVLCIVFLASSLALRLRRAKRKGQGSLGVLAFGQGEIIFRF
jgi:hypothetical protein